MTALILVELLGVVVGWIALLRWAQPTGLSPDGQFYLAMAQGQDVPRPYCFRWLLPATLATDQRAWSAVGLLAMAAAALLLSFKAPAHAQLYVAALFLGLPMVRLWLRLPVLVDSVAFALALAAAYHFQAGHWGLGVVYSLIAGMSKESAPVFAAAWSLNPLALIGLLGVPWWRKGATTDIPWLLKPWEEARKVHQGLNPLTLLLPWGAVAWFGLLGVSGVTGWQLLSAGLSLGLGYAQLLRSQDAARLYQWAFPALVPLVVAGTPPEWMALVAVLHLVGQIYRGA